LLLFPRSLVYVSLIDLLVDLHASEPARGYDREAFRYVQLAKARSLRDLLEGASAEATAKIPQELLERRRDLARRIVAVEAEMRRPSSAGSPPQNLEPTLEALEREEMQVLEQIRTRFPEYVTLAPQPVAIESLQQQVLRPGELLVEYFLTSQRILLFAVARDRFALAETKEPLRNNLLPALALRDLLRNPEGWNLELSEDLYDRLLKPIESDLQRAKAVYIAPDSILHYLPFEILGPGGKVLIDAPFSISYIPSASVLETLRRRPPPRADRLPLLVVADPVGWDAPKEPGGPANREVLTDLFGETGPCSDLRFRPLVHAGGEALALAGVYGLDPAGPEMLLRENATEARLRALDLQRFRYLHFATHGVLCDDGGASSLRSSLVLSAPAAGAGTTERGEDGLLDVHEIFNLSLDTDLVTLSACQTGLGSEVAGEGLVGLTQAFLYAGSRSVLVSLWSVEDRSTARFMKRFYRNLRNGMSRGEALQETKRWMLYESYDVDSYGNQLRHVHPFYWAPFILIGSQD
jgi:CHAT domain-containing protein